MQPFLIDEDGETRPVTSPRIMRQLRSLRPECDLVAYAVSELGFIHIRGLRRSLIVSFRPQLVQPLTMTGAFYAIAELNPERTLICPYATNQTGELFPGFRLALHRIHRLVAAAGSAKLCARDTVDDRCPS